MKKPAAPGTPFGDGPRWSLLDLPRCTFDVVSALARRRNLPEMPWWRRYARTWQTFDLSGESPEHDAAQDIVLYGLTSVWNEDDVIYATVRNLFMQGVEKVFVIDDSSDDDTVTEAKAAGATVLHDESDGIFLEQRRTERLSRLIDERTEEAGRPVWWIVVDADEFPRGPNGTTIHEFVRGLSPNVDTVGSRVLDHYPDSSSAPMPRFHPIDEMPNARWYNRPTCRAGHWKHQLLQVRRPGELRFMPGRHAIAAPADRKPVVESMRSLLMHHFPLRDRERTERKLRLSGSTVGRYTKSRDAFLIGRVNSRLRTLELAYQNDYEAMPNVFPGEPRRGISVTDWRDLVSPSERTMNHQIGEPL